MKFFLGLAGIGILMLSGCKVTQNTNGDNVQGITLPFYEQTRFEVNVLKKEGRSKLSNKEAGRFYRLHLTLLKHMADGNIKAYQTDSFRSVYSKKSFLSRGRMEDYSGEEETLVDSAYLTKFKDQIDRKRFFKYQVIQGWHWDEQASQGTISLLGLVPIFEPTAGGENLGEQPLGFIRFSDIEDALSNKELNELNNLLENAMLAQFLPNQNEQSFRYKEGNKNGFRSYRPMQFKINDSLLGRSGKMMNHVHFHLYDSATRAMIDAYTDGTLSQKLSKEEVAKQGGETKTIPRSPDMDNPQYVGTKEVFIPFIPSQVRNYGVQEKWELAEMGQYQITPRAFAPLKNQTPNSENDQLKPLFWLSGEELEDGLGPSKAAWLRKYSFFTLQDRLAELDGKIFKPSRN